MTSQTRSECPCPPGQCANMTSDKFRCKAHARPFDRTDLAIEYVRKLADDAVNLTIENKPLEPLAMGNYESVIDVRAKRVRS